MRGLRIALGLVGIFGLTTAAVAAEPGIYVGGGVGWYNVKIDNVGTSDFEDSASAWRALGGYQLNKYIGVQADYVWYSDTQDQVPQNSSINATVNGDAWEAAVRLSYPLGEMFEPYVRVGWNWYTVDAKLQFVKGQSDSNDAMVYAGGSAP